MQFVSEIKYLGVYICSGRCFARSFDNSKLKFYRCFNAIFCKSKSSSSEIVTVNLLKAYCLPIILYACEAISPSKRDFVVLDKLIDRAVSKIFNTFDQSIASATRDFLNLDSVENIVVKRKKNFTHNFVKFFFILRKSLIGVAFILIYSEC